MNQMKIKPKNAGLSCSKPCHKLMEKTQCPLFNQHGVLGTSRQLQTCLKSFRDGHPLSWVWAAVWTGAAGSETAAGHLQALGGRVFKGVNVTPRR